MKERDFFMKIMGLRNDWQNMLFDATIAVNKQLEEMGADLVTPNDVSPVLLSLIWERIESVKEDIEEENGIVDDLYKKLTGWK